MLLARSMTLMRDHTYKRLGGSPEYDTRKYFSLSSSSSLSFDDSAVVLSCFKLAGPSKRDEVAIINIVQAQVEELYFIFNLKYRLSLYLEGYHIYCHQSLNAQHSLKPK
jgi:hypothetical protein